MATAASSAAEKTLPSFEFSADSPPPRLTLSPNQYKYCSQALKFFKDKLQMPHQINQEFALLQGKRITASEMKRSCTVALDSVNVSKNRYTDVLPFDQNRVVLNSCKDYRPSARGYINASFITACSSESISRFIATQGPLPHTYEDFWEMVLENQCPVVVMLTRLVDYYKMDKCGDYFQAEDGPREFGNICIATKWIRTTGTSLILRLLEVNRKESEEPPMSVLHIQYPEWPDHGVPTDTIAVREILKTIYQVPPNLGPVLVHCSAGIGRTGTYCTVHNTTQRILSGDMSALDLANTITTFRTERIGMVQTLEQIFFCYSAIIDELEDLIADQNSEMSSKEEGSFRQYTDQCDILPYNSYEAMRILMEDLEGSFGTPYNESINHVNGDRRRFSMAGYSFAGSGKLNEDRSQQKQKMDHRPRRVTRSRSQNRRSRFSRNKS